MNKAELDRIAQAYHTSPDVPDKHIEDLCQQYAATWMLTRLGGARRVLELGVGEGIITQALVADGRTVTVVEGARVLYEEIRERFRGRLDAVHALFEEFAPCGTFDAVVASHVLEHVDDPVALLKRMRAWLSRDGRLIVVVPNKESLHRRLAVIMGLQPALDTLSPRDHLVGHRRVYSHATLARDLNDAGFQVTEATGFFLKPLANSMMLGYAPELLAAMNEIAAELPKELLANIGVVAVTSD